VATGDFDGNGYDDLLVGVPLEDLTGGADAGAANVIYGSSAGLTSASDDFWNQDSDGINNDAQEQDQFGLSVSAGDFDGDGYDDAAIGVPGEDVSNHIDAGGVSVIYGTSAGLDDPNDDFWHQNSSGILDSAEDYDIFGFSVTAVDVGNGGEADLIAGVPLESIGSVDYAGAINVIYGSASDLTSTSNQFWNQDSADILDQAEYDDEFGFGLGELGTGAVPGGGSYIHLPGHG
jgi:hypothetical protein